MVEGTAGYSQAPGNWQESQDTSTGPRGIGTPNPQRYKYSLPTVVQSSLWLFTPECQVGIVAQAPLL